MFTKREKLPGDCGPEAAFKFTSTSHYPAFTSGVKRVIVHAALSGILPIRLATWLIQRLHLGAA